VIQLEQVDKHFGSHHVLKQISLKVAMGEKVVVIGPSGSGKSTARKRSPARTRKRSSA
jgi:ABC-type polar amino acid transport system ATPase subunit